MIGHLRVAWIALGVSLLTLALVPLQLAAMLLGGRARSRLPRLWHRGAAAIVGLKVETEGVPSPHGPLLLSANHQSWLDILVLGSVVDASFVAKTEVRGWPVFGVLARLHRTIFVDRGRKRDVRLQVDQIAGRLRDGESLVLFAEGTTSDGNGVLPFKSALFAAAEEALGRSDREAILVQPVCVAYTRHHGLPLGRAGRSKVTWIGGQTFGPHLMSVLRDGAFDAKVIFAPPLRFTARDDRKALAAACERAVCERLVGALHPRG